VLHVLDDVELDAQLTRRGESVLGRSSMRVVVDGHVGHACTLGARRPARCHGYGAAVRLIALHCGDLRTDAGVLFEGRPSGTAADVPIMTYAVDTGDGVLLFDTGVNERCLTDLGGYLGPMMALAFEAVGGPETLTPARVDQAGFSVDDVRWVVNSHLHFDHCGCNRTYPASTWVVRSQEVAFYRSKLSNPAFGLGAEDLGPEQPPELVYDGEHDLTGDGRLVLLDTKGHTPGHQSLQVTFGDGRRHVLVGDAAYTRDAIESGEPQGFPWDRELAKDALARLRALEADGATLLLAHDADQWRGVADVADVHASP
jgi:glyoxylase-like metal-dependent hydrolase (beta-lactamase superfamily II)